MSATIPPIVPRANAHRFELAPGICLDARRAVWFEKESVLAVADLHLGYAWAHRAEGNLFPISAQDDAIDRLAALAREYQPREVVILGDIVHRAVPIEPVREELRRLCRELPETKLQLIVGNHDRALGALLRDCKIALPLASEARIGPHLFLHGDRPVAESEPTSPPGGLIFMGHEHPAILLGDGVTRMKCPCFLAREDLVILPAFSRWAAGSDVRSGTFLSPLAKLAKFKRAIAILADKLVPVRL